MENKIEKLEKQNEELKAEALYRARCKEKILDMLIAEEERLYQQIEFIQEFKRRYIDTMEL